MNENWNDETLRKIIHLMNNGVRIVVVTYVFEISTTSLKGHLGRIVVFQKVNLTKMSTLTKGYVHFD
jgi:hypothetical protein